MKRICVFCGSSPGARRQYAAAAEHLGREIARRGLGLVYGGGNVGLMAVVADAVLAVGGEVIGVIPEPLVAKELAHAGVADLRVVDSMHARKALMADLSDGFLALPGGIGTFEEMFEVLTWAQLGFHDKPCGLLDVGGYYRPLIAFLDHAVEERFLAPEHRALLLVNESADGLLESMRRYRPPEVEKWIDRDDL